MRSVRPIGEAEMVAAFLASEYPSPRTHQQILEALQREGESDLVVLKGRLRLTAMFLAPECLPADLEVIVGFSAQMENWGCY